MHVLNPDPLTAAVQAGLWLGIAALVLPSVAGKIRAAHRRGLARVRRLDGKGGSSWL